MMEAETVQHIFSNNYQLCSEISESVLQHFIHCLATHGRHVQYLNFLHTIIKAEGKYVKKCQDMIMTEVRTSSVTLRHLPCFMSFSTNVLSLLVFFFCISVDQRRGGRGGFLQRQSFVQCHVGADGGEQRGSGREQPTQVLSDESIC